MKNVNLVTAMILLLLLAGCLGMPTRPVVKDNPITADQELIEYVKSQGWLEKNCNAPYGYDFYGKWKKKFRQCVQVDTALLEPYDPQKADHFGKDYDPEKYYKCRIEKDNPGDMGCDRYKLVRNEPEPVWPYPDVPPIKWSASPEEQVYYPGISRKEYFVNLCLKESGHFIYRTVDNVQGVYQVRPRYPEIKSPMFDPYAMEDPYGFHISDGYGAVMRVLSLGYKYVETSLYDPWNDEGRVWRKKRYHASLFKPIENSTRYFRFERARKVEGSLSKILRKNQIKNVESKYGYVWRGIKRPKDREMGIAGGELAIVDLHTNEILGLIRGFALTSIGSNGNVSWLTARRCAMKRDADGYGFDKFIRQVLKPDPNNRVIRKSLEKTI